MENDFLRSFSCICVWTGYFRLLLILSSAVEYALSRSAHVHSLLEMLGILTSSCSLRISPEDLTWESHLRTAGAGSICDSGTKLRHLWWHPQMPQLGAASSRGRCHCMPGGASACAATRDICRGIHECQEEVAADAAVGGRCHCLCRCLGETRGSGCLHPYRLRSPA